jgi:uncharacterized protein (TIGR00369 family)
MSAYDMSTPVINRGTSPHHCFGCGTLNDIGLQLAFRIREDKVWADLTPTRKYEGYVDMVHGGVLSAMLDEAMSWAITAAGDFAVTARMNTTFKHPARVGAHLRVEGWINEQKRRLIYAEASISDVVAGKIVATAEGAFMRVDETQAQAWRSAYLDKG